MPADLSQFQTLLYQTLNDEFGLEDQVATIAAVACISPSLLNSSLGPNLLALDQISVGDDDCSRYLDLFGKIFNNKNFEEEEAHSPSTLQFTRSLSIDVQSYGDVEDYESDNKQKSNILSLLSNLSNSPYFSRSVKEIFISGDVLDVGQILHTLVFGTPSSSTAKSTRILPPFSTESLCLTLQSTDSSRAALRGNPDAWPQYLKFREVLPYFTNLKELTFSSWSSNLVWSSSFFEIFGRDIKNNPAYKTLKSLKLNMTSQLNFDHESFRDDFCFNFLDNNTSLTSLKFDGVHFPRFMTNEDVDVLSEMRLPNLVELEHVPVQVIVEASRKEPRDDDEWMNDNEIDEEEKEQIPPTTIEKPFVNLRLLRISKVNDADLEIVVKHCLFLETLDVVNDTFQLFRYDRNATPPLLTGSFLRSTNSASSSSCLPNLRTLKIADKHFSDEEIGDGFKNLLSLEILDITSGDHANNAHVFDGSSLVHLPHPERLQNLDFASCYGLTNESLKQFLPRFKNLKLLRFMRGHQFTNDGIKEALPSDVLQNLELLAFNFCAPNITPACFVPLAPHLKSIRVLQYSCTGDDVWLYFKDVLPVLENTQNTLKSLLFSAQYWKQNANRKLDEKTGCEDIDDPLREFLEKRFPHIDLGGAVFDHMNKDKEEYEKYCSTNATNNNRRRDRE